MARFPTVGEVFGDYRIVSRLGGGATSTVFAAEHVTLGRTVALKVLIPELTDEPTYQRRFSREATLLARVDSPHIIGVFEHGSHDGCLFIATQYARGGDLASALRTYGPLPSSAAARVVGQLAEGLGDAHRAGILHRDVKPGNVLLHAIEPDLHAYLGDFGLAGEATDTGVPVGAPTTKTAGRDRTYAAPEVIAGQQATHAADIYSLGCVLFTALTGHAPTERPLDPPTTDADSARLAAVIARATAAHPAGRYSDAGAMREDLARLTKAAPPTSPPFTPTSQPQLPPTGSSARSARPRRARTIGLMAGLVTALLLTVGGVAVGTGVIGGDDEPLRGASDPDPSPEPEPTPDPTPTPGPTPQPSPTPEPPDPEPEPQPEPEPEPFYPSVPAAAGPPMSVGGATVNAPDGWGRIDSGVLERGLGARDYSDFEGFYSSVFFSRSRTSPVFRQDFSLLETLAEGAVTNDPEGDGVLLKGTLQESAWLDGRQAARAIADYEFPGQGLFLTEETWFVTKGKYLYTLRFQHSRVDTKAERRAQIDPVVVSFRFD